MNPGNNPLDARFAIHHGPYVIRIVAKRNFQVFAEGLKTEPTPYFAPCVRVAKRLEEFLECIFVQDASPTFALFQSESLILPRKSWLIGQ
jgi:hypothetical protein